MAQWGLPVGNSGTTDWTQVVGLGDDDGDWFDELDEGHGAGRGTGSGPDTTAAWKSAQNPVNSRIQTILSAVTDPAVSTGHIFRTRSQKSAAAGRQIDVTIELRNSSGLIASAGFTNISEVPTTREIALTGTEADSITDYGDLIGAEIANVAGSGAGRSCVETAHEFEVPDAPAGVEVAITGNSGTGGLGSFAAAVVIALSGVAGTGAVGSLDAAVSAAISGNAATGAVGTIAAGISYNVPITGNEATGAVGTLVPSAAYAVALTGEAATGAAGSVAARVSRSLTGEAGTAAAGTLVPSASYSRAITGNEATGSVGSLAASVSAPLSGNEGAGAVGTLSPESGVVVALTGNEATGSVGALVPSVSVALGGNAATGSVGTVVPSSGSPPDPPADNAHKRMGRFHSGYNSGMGT